MHKSLRPQEHYRQRMGMGRGLYDVISRRGRQGYLGEVPWVAVAEPVVTVKLFLSRCDTASDGVDGGGAVEVEIALNVVAVMVLEGLWSKVRLEAVCRYQQWTRKRRRWRWWWSSAWSTALGGEDDGVPPWGGAEGALGSLAVGGAEEGREER